MKATALIPISGAGHSRAFLSLVQAPVKRTPEPSERRLRAVPSKPCPARLYLAGLHASGRRAMAARLRSVARLVGLSPEEIRWSGLRSEVVSVIRALMIERSYAPASVNATLSALKGVAHAAWQLKLIKSDEYQRIRDVKGVRGSRLPRGRALADREVSRLVEACLRDASPAGARDLALVALLGSGGLRRSEATTLDLSHLDEEAGTLRVLGKGDKERLVYLGREALRTVLDWLGVRGTDAGPLLRPVSKAGCVEMRRLSDHAVYKALRKRAKEAHVRAFSPHDLGAPASPTCWSAAETSRSCRTSPATPRSRRRRSTTAAARRPRDARRRSPRSPAAGA